MASFRRKQTVLDADEDRGGRPWWACGRGARATGGETVHGVWGLGWPTLEWEGVGRGWPAARAVGTASCAISPIEA